MKLRPDNSLVLKFGPNATRPLSRCYLRSNLVKNTAGAYKEPNKKYKSNLEEQATSNAELNTSISRV